MGKSTHKGIKKASKVQECVAQNLRLDYTNIKSKNSWQNYFENHFDHSQHDIEAILILQQQHIIYLT